MHFPGKSLRIFRCRGSIHLDQLPSWNQACSWYAAFILKSDSHQFVLSPIVRYHDFPRFGLARTCVLYCLGRWCDLLTFKIKWWRHCSHVFEWWQVLINATRNCHSLQQIMYTQKECTFRHSSWRNRYLGTFLLLSDKLYAKSAYAKKCVGKLNQGWCKLRKFNHGGIYCLATMDRKYEKP